MNFDPTVFAGQTPEQLAKLDVSVLEELAKYYRYIEVAPIACRTDLLKFTHYTTPDPDHPFDQDFSLYDEQPHHRLIAEALTEIMDGKNLYLILSMPPQTGKTELAVRKFLPYHLGRYPWKHLIIATYNQTFSEEHGDDVRTCINSEEYQRVFPSTKLRQGSKSKEHMVTTRGGKVSFIGRGGTGAGRPADGLLIDDPLKDAKEAESKTTRDDTWNWYNRVAENRCHSLSWRIIISTRWSDDDLIARLTDPKNPYYNEAVAKQFTVINIPSIMDNEDIAKALGKKVGDALWPGRFSLDLLQRRRQMDPYGFSALHMGRPTPPEGAYFKQVEIHTYSHISQFPKRGINYLSGDLAVSPEKNADSSCVGPWALDENDVLWLAPEVYWDKKSSDETVDKIIELGCQFGVLDAFFEKGQIDKAIGPFLEKRMQEEVNAGKKAYFSITRLSVAGNKGVKAMPLRGRMRQGKVMFPAFSPWWLRAKEQLLKFTGSGNDKEDDFVDMCANIGQAIQMQVKASGDPKVVNFPKVGSFGWTKWAATQEREQARRSRLLRGV